MAQRQTSGYMVNPQSSRSLILSPTHPQDSRAEAVYEIPGESQKDLPIVPGAVVQAVPLKIPIPKYPKSLKRTKSDAVVKVTGVVAQNGDFIDPILPTSIEPDVRTAIVKALAKYRFRPATLDGKPIAELIVIEIQFRIR